MYYFNQKLLSELNKILGKSNADISTELGFGKNRIQRWIDEQSISVPDFVQLLNRFRLSMADFLITKEEVPVDWKKETYIAPIETWNPVVWHSENIKEIFGKPNAANVVDKTGLCKALGISDRTSVDRWANTGSMKMKTFIDMLNKLQLDAKDFISDYNKVIACPDWMSHVGFPVDKVNEMMSEQKRMQAILREKDSLIADLQMHVKELKKEIAALKQLTRSSIAAEPAFVRPFGRREYTFNVELWRALPDVFGMSQQDFCGMIGMSPSRFMFDHLNIDFLVRACNALRISVTHFFPPKGEIVIVRNRGYYEISKNLFKPIEDCSENLEIILKKRTSGITVQEFAKVTGYHANVVKNFTAKKSNKRSVLGLVHICNTLGIPINVFLQDPNGNGRAMHSGTLNETLAENCIAMYKELEKLKDTKKEKQ